MMSRLVRVPVAGAVGVAVAKNVAIAVSAALSVLMLSGCVMHTGRLNSLAHDLDRDLPGVRFERQNGVKLGRMSMGLAKGIARWAMDDEDLEEFESLRGIKKVEVANYLALGETSVGRPERLERSLSKSGWETLARFRDDGEMGWVLYRLDDGRIRNMIVMVLDHDELTMVRLSGQLDLLITSAIQLARSEMRDS